MYFHHVVAVGASVVQDVGVESVVAVVVRMFGIVCLASLHAILVHMVLCRSVGSRIAGEKGRSCIAVELVSELV